VVPRVASRHVVENRAAARFRPSNRSIRFFLSKSPNYSEFAPPLFPPPSSRSVGRWVNPWGMFNLAICYLYGQGAPVNHTLAFEWLRKVSLLILLPHPAHPGLGLPCAAGAAHLRGKGPE